MVDDRVLEELVPFRIGQVAGDLVDGMVVEEGGVVLHALLAWEEEPLPEFEDPFQFGIGHGFEV